MNKYTKVLYDWEPVVENNSIREYYLRHPLDKNLFVSFYFSGYQGVDMKPLWCIDLSWQFRNLFSEEEKSFFEHSIFKRYVSLNEKDILTLRLKSYCFKIINNDIGVYI